MYVPAPFIVDDDTAWDIVAQAGAGSLVHFGAAGLQSVYTPVDVNSSRTVLRAHLAKANDWWRHVHDGDEILAIFLAASGYVSPSNYPSRLDGVQHVPTWNYVAAEVRGVITLHHAAGWLAEQTRAVTEQFEAPRSPQWRVDEARATYLEKQYEAIVGISIDVTGITGKAKLSQNRLPEDRAAVLQGFATGSSSEQNVAAWMER